jgi:hypothetical protein
MAMSTDQLQPAIGSSSDDSWGKLAQAEAAQLTLKTAKKSKPTTAATPSTASPMHDASMSNTGSMVGKSTSRRPYPRIRPPPQESADSPEATAETSSGKRQR